MVLSEHEELDDDVEAEEVEGSVELDEHEGSQTPPSDQPATSRSTMGSPPNRPRTSAPVRHQQEKSQQPTFARSATAPQPTAPSSTSADANSAAAPIAQTSPTAARAQATGAKAASSTAPKAAASHGRPGGSAPGKRSAISGAANRAADKLVKSKPEDEGTGGGAAKQALKDAAIGAAEGAATKGGVPGAALGALKGLGGTFTNNMVFRNSVLMVLAVLIGAMPMALGIGLLMLTSIGSGGADEGVHTSKVASVNASEVSGNSIGGVQHALSFTGSSAPWTIVLAANERIGNDEDKQAEELERLKERGPVEYSDESPPEAPENAAETPPSDELDAVSQAVSRAADHYDTVKSDRDRQSAKDSKQVFGWDLYSFSKILSWADPSGAYSNVAAGAVAANQSEGRARAIYDPDDGGSEALFNKHKATKTLYVNALKEAGVSGSNAEKIFDQALEWELGTIGCASDAKPASNGTQPGSNASGDWLKPGTEKHAVAQQIFDILTKEYGVSGAFAAGVLGNIEQESGFNVEVTNSIGAKGLFQFLPASKAEPWMTGGSWSIENQIAAMWGLEFKNKAVWLYVQRNAPGTFDSMEDWLSSDDPVAAGKAFLLGYERPGDHEAMADKRAENARAADAAFNSSKVRADPKKWKFADGTGGPGDSSETASASVTKCADEEASSTWLADGSCNPKNDATGWFWPSDQFTINQGYHDGYALDMGSAPGGAKCSPYDGVVVYSGDDTPISPYWAGCPAPWHGNNVAVIVKHEYQGKVIYSAHSHLAKGTTAPVGSKVKAGQQIASAGMSGCTTGPHAHFALSTSPTSIPQNIDPYQYIPRP